MGLLVKWIIGPIGKYVMLAVGALGFLKIVQKSGEKKLANKILKGRLDKIKEKDIVEEEVENRDDDELIDGITRSK